jgi:multicomponent Na+:H+ antiporter subunit G
MKEIIVSFFLLSGAFFIFIAALGILRLPDLYTRMHASAKASSLGVGLFAIGAGVYFAEVWVFLESVLIILFIFLTAPVSAHMIARAGYFLKVRIWEGTVVDELKNRYDLKKGILHSIKGIQKKGNI